MMAARAGKRGPGENGIDEMRLIEACVRERAAVAVKELTHALILGVPDRQLALKVAEARDDRKLNAGVARRSLHCEQLLDHLMVQDTAELRDLANMGAGTAGELKGIEHFLADSRAMQGIRLATPQRSSRGDPPRVIS